MEKTMSNTNGATRRGSASKRIARASFVVDDNTPGFSMKAGGGFPSFVLDGNKDRRASGNGLTTSFDIPEGQTPSGPSPALLNRKGSVVFPSLAMAERSAALRKSKSGLAQIVLQRRKSLANLSNENADISSMDPFGEVVDDLRDGMTPPPSSLSTLALSRRKSTRIESAASMLLLRNGSTASAGSLGSGVGFGMKRRLVSFRTAVMAVMMLVRIHAAVERRRRALKIRDQAVTPRDSVSAGSSLPNTARTAAAAPTPHATLRKDRADAYGAAATQVPPSSSSTTVGASSSVVPPQAAHLKAVANTGTLPNMSFFGAGALITGGEALNHSNNNNTTTIADDDHSSHSSEGGSLEDQLSVASWDSNDRISEASEDDGEDGKGGGAVRMTFFPHPRDIAQLPAEMRVHLERRALKSLRRFIAVYRFRRYVTARHSRRTKPTVGSLPAGVLDSSDIFRGWSSSMVEGVLASAYSQTWYGGSFIAYPREPQRFVYIVTEGSTCEIRHRQSATTAATSGSGGLRSSLSATPVDSSLNNGGKLPNHSDLKRLSPSTKNAEILRTYQTPVVLKANAALVQHVGGAEVGIFAVTSCTVVVLLVSEVERIFRTDTSSLSESARAAVCERYKSIRQDRSLVFLRGRMSILEREVQADALAAKAAAAARVLGTVVEDAEHPVANNDTAGGNGGGGETQTTANHNAQTKPQEVLSLNLRSSKLLEHLNKEQERLVIAKLIPQSYFAGESILDKGQDDFKNIYFVLRGTVVAVSKYRDDATAHEDPLSASRRQSRRRSARGASSAGLNLSQNSGGGGGGGAKDSVWRDMIFSRWRAGESVGDKALYFQEPHVFTLRAETNCDLVVLKRAVLMSLMDSAERSGLKQCVASGAFAVRANDPVVRLRLSSVRSIPCIEAALDDGIIQDATVRELHALFKIHVFPAGELITSSSATVKRIVVTSTGTAVVDVNSALPFTLINGTPIGCTLLANMRWRYAIYAETECEGWVLPVEDFVAFCKSRGILKRMTELSVEQYQILQRTDGSDDMLFEIPTPQDVVMMALAHAGNVAAQTTLKSKLILPSHRILEQRSFHQKLPADVPVPPLPPPAPVSFPSHTAALIHRPSVAYAGGSTKASSTPQAADAPLRRDSVNSNHSADGATTTGQQHPQSVVAVHHLSTPGKQPLLLSARKSEPFASLTPGGPPPLTLSITPRPSMSSPPSAADSHQSPKTPHQHKQQLGLHFNSPGRDEPRTPRPDHFSLSARIGDAFSADADINNPSTMKITPRPSLPKPLTLPYDEFQHDTAHHHDSGGHNNNSTTTPLLNASSNTSNGDRGGDATTPPSTTKLNGGGGASMSRRRQLLYRFMEDFMDRSLSGTYSSTSPTATSAGGHHYGHDAHHHYKSLESPLLVVDPSASNASLEEGGQQQQQHSIGVVDWNSASPVSHDRQEGGGGHYYERGGSFSSASSPHRHHQVELLHHGGLEVTSPVGLLPRRSATPSSAASSQRHMMLKTFSSSSFYQLRQSEKLQEQRQQSGSLRRPHSSSSSTIPHPQQQQQQQHAPPSNSCNAAMVGTKRWCLTPPPHATYGQSLRLQAISYVWGGRGIDEPLSPYFQGGQQRQSRPPQQRNNERSKQ